MLTRDTLEQKKKNIQWDTLSRTFRDAVVLTRGIGVQYIWIDSLCIIQDDPDDWKNEAANMASIYEGALMVLSATASTNGETGCFHDREPPVVLQVALDSGSPFTIFARRVLPHLAFRSGFIEYQWKSGMKDSLLSDGVPLFSRAWCFQERLLGTRTLHFLRQEMVFDCLESTNCECGALFDYSEESTRTMRKSIKHGISTERISRFRRGKLSPDQWIAPSCAQLSDDIFNETWRRLVEGYSRKNITYLSDVLPALSGLAYRWSSITGTDYLCGLWTDGLLPGLMWYAGSKTSSTGIDVNAAVDKRPAKHKDTYVAPSWSWASTWRPVAWPLRDFVELSYMVDIDRRNSGCTYSGPDVFGGISSGWLVISGKLTSVRVTTFDPFQLESEFDKKDTIKFYYSPDDERACEESLGKQVFCLDYATNNLLRDSHFALILAPADPGQHDGAIGLVPDKVKQLGQLYRRVGITDRFPWLDLKPVRGPKTTMVII
ncbi:putative protein TOL [Rosellinia necatrix]|uniref:Heterokaryon incompatibility domain-containing protein n=1 Tax=Rosellinia necatrix TaxID=77044 RepID=A0A1W2TNG6_ROSNE|nr:putative protein TOL [Rosellinia necatrix]